MKKIKKEELEIEFKNLDTYKKRYEKVQELIEILGSLKKKMTELEASGKISLNEVEMYNNQFSYIRNTQIEKFMMDLLDPEIDVKYLRTKYAATYGYCYTIEAELEEISFRH